MEAYRERFEELKGSEQACELFARTGDVVSDKRLMNSDPGESSNDQVMNLTIGEIRCAKCQSLNLRGNRRCSQCGAHLYILCGHCNHKNERSLDHCGNCGSRLRGPPSPHKHRKAFDDERDNQRADKVVPVVLVIVFGLLIAWLARYMGWG